ncbi:hypothetical protein [Streptomyces halobius]|uniref:Uncharacterized protein n=1 Tax=Streptomyces halobius TaxID=2879846 RepID=A0ABY4MK19_9ACTN|nr:hypothetical protein [Streptomyces halobius]UQA98184.1 hypothetical protein K9S39_10190 [Streptomyces halobius]
MAPLEQVAVPPHDRVRAYQQQELAQLPHREVVEQAGEDSAVGVRERGFADLTLQYEQLVPQGKKGLLHDLVTAGFMQPGLRVGS